MISSNFFSLKDINGINGFKITGANKGDQFGATVIDVGDVNGDGISDMLITAPKALGGNGQAYVIYGRDFWFDAEIDISSLTPEQGFTINTNNTRGGFGLSAGGGYDVNGDGIKDFLITEPYYDSPSSGSGGVYVFYGQNQNFNSTLNVGDLDGNNGFYIKGVNLNDRTGVQTIMVDSINNDQYAEIFVGAVGANPQGDKLAARGSISIVYGNKTMPAVFELANEPITKILGAPTDIGIGWSSAVIDMNLDGNLDLAVSNTGYSGDGVQSKTNSGHNIGEVYVYYGPDFPETIHLDSINGTNGFRIVGEGINDLTGFPTNIGSIGNSADILAINNIYGNNYAGRVDYIFASDSPRPEVFNVSKINAGPGKEGFSIAGFLNLEVSGGYNVAGYKSIDYNQDGYPDLAFIANIASEKGGEAFIVYTHPDMPRYTYLNDLEGGKGFGIAGITPASDGTRVGFPVTGVSVLADGKTDIAIGDPFADQVFVIYGDHAISEAQDF